MNRSLGYRAPLLWLVLPLLAGLALGRMGDFAPVPWQLAGALLAATAAVIASWRNARWWAPALSVALMLAGSASYGLHRARLTAWDALPPREARVSLRVDRVFAREADSPRVLGLATVVRADEHLREIVGQRIYFGLNLRKGDAAPIRSAVVSTVGLLATLPRDPPADSFDGYLAGAGVNFKLTRGRILSEEQRAHAYYRFCALAAERCKTILGRGIEAKYPALAALLRGMMLGETHELSNEQHTLFMQSGTMHLFAISGLNIGVIAAALQTVLIFARMPAWGRFVVGAALLWLFVDITGASPSAVRAWVMAVVLHAAFVVRRPTNPLAAVTASAFAVVVIAPLQVFSASFLMSYGIVFALLVLGLPLSEAWQAWWSPWRDLPEVTWSRWQRFIAWGWRWLAPGLTIGLATTLVGLITGVQFFGLLTPGALVANLILIPAAVGVTILGFVSLVMGLVGLGFGAAICNHLAAWLLYLIEHFVRVSVQVPGMFIRAHFSAPWIGPVTFAALLIALGAGYAADWKKNRGGWWPPFAIVAVALVFGVEYSNP